MEKAKKCEIHLKTRKKTGSFSSRDFDRFLLAQYECPKCFEQSDSQTKYSQHLQAHFPRATAEERAGVEHIVSSNAVKNSSKNYKRNPIFAGYIKQKPYQKSRKQSAAQKIMMWAVFLGEFGG